MPNYFAWSTEPRQTRSAARRPFQEANSVLERITLAPWVNLTSEKLASETKPVSSLPDGKLKVAVDQVPQEADAKRITVEIDWKTGQAMRASPVRLSAWVCRRGETP